ncbi:SSS sodium solute transporter superfamily [Candidatus Koribacter versatilis Ellin345]|uniref:SSS sodium solute transporter superfamily n=1 Tax=Koribacter versatilis (strain Ellin345) TaxID=204669 RepID=Q1IUX1_KORVE|nr:sodium:solute symporter family protein [Candidatus Koribacter versatilis]ABF39329.1 SSS sodium solute transporter superfamily [Candidatus Koribacter versatilis Ellin345]
MSPLLASFVADRLVNLSSTDLVIIVFYFALVLAIGWQLKGQAKTGEDFFMAGREMTAWIAGLSFLSANLGSLELMGWAGAAYQYGILAAHWYWIGAIPAMIFLGLVMMPFYYISKTHSVPGYLKLRFGEPSRALSAVSFAFMTVLMSGINMYSMALVMKVVLGWDINVSIIVSSITVAIYVTLGGLRSAIFNEVLQFILIWAGALLIPIMGLIEAGGWTNLKAQITRNASAEYTHLWSTLGKFSDNPMGINWIGIVFGLGAIISMGYWTTDFLVVQRVLAAKDMRSAKMAPIIGAAFKMLVPFIVILPGLLALAVLPMKLVGESQAIATHGHSYNEVLPLMLARYCGPGLLGLGITALIAGFMSGMAGNVSAFTTVWTYDIYRAMIKKDASDAHYVNMGRASTIGGVIISILTAYFVMKFASIMDYVQALFSFFIAPLFATVVLGMLWKRATNAGGFWGLLAGTVSSVGMYAWVKLDPSALRYVAMSPDAQAMAENMYRALWSCLICALVTVVVSYATKPRPDAELVGLVKSVTPIPSEGDVPMYMRPAFWACVVAVGFIILQIIFW